jgi:hypothetical protein
MVTLSGNGYEARLGNGDGNVLERNRETPVNQS